MVVSTERHASTAGVGILMAGGNAINEAITTPFVLVFPTLSF